MVDSLRKLCSSPMFDESHTGAGERLCLEAVLGCGDRRVSTSPPAWYLRRSVSEPAKLCKPLGCIDDSAMCATENVGDTSERETMSVVGRGKLYLSRTKKRDDKVQ